MKFLDLVRRNAPRTARGEGMKTSVCSGSVLKVRKAADVTFISFRGQISNGSFSLEEPNSQSEPLESILKKSMSYASVPCFSERTLEQFKNKRLKRHSETKCHVFDRLDVVLVGSEGARDGKRKEEAPGPM